MKVVFKILPLLFVLLLCSCSDNHPKKVKQKGIEQKLSDDTINFNAYLKLFTEVTPPFTMVDSVAWVHGDTCKKLSKPMIERFIRDTSQLTHNNKFIRMIPMEMLDDNWYWIAPYIRMKTDSLDILYILSYERISETNGDYTNVIALVYNRQHQLIKAVTVGNYGCYSSRNFTDGDLTHWEHTADFTDLTVNINTPLTVDAITTKWRMEEGNFNSETIDSSYRSETERKKKIQHIRIVD